MTMMSRRAFTMLAAGTVCFSAHADAFPARPIKIIVGFAPGGSTDAVARYYAQKLSEVLKSSVIVDNKPGAGQMVAIRSALAAPPDGYTLYLGTGSALSQLPGVRSDLTYNTLKDFSLVGLLASAPGVIVVSPRLPARTLGELAKLPEALDGKMNYASSGVGSASHLQTEYLLKLTGIRMAHIPFKSDADIMREIAVGSVQFGISPVQGAMSAIAGGKVRALAVTGSHRIKGLPDVPSLRETDFQGIASIDPYTYYALLGPAGLPPAIVGKLNDAVSQVSAMPDVVARMQDQLYFEPESGTPERLRKYIQADLAKWTAFGKNVKLTD